MFCIRPYKRMEEKEKKLDLPEEEEKSTFTTTIPEGFELKPSAASMQIIRDLETRVTSLELRLFELHSMIVTTDRFTKQKKLTSVGQAVRRSLR